MEHRTRDCEEREAEKGAMMTKINVPANDEMTVVAATTGVARGDGKEERDSDSGASFHMFHTQTRLTACKKEPAGTTFDIFDGTIFPVDRFGTIEVDLDQPGTTIKTVKIIVCAIPFTEPAVHL